MSNWLTEIKKDLLKKEFWPLKVVYFLIVGGVTTLIPFLTIQARTLGITKEELGFIYSLLPFIGILAPSIAGLLADKIGNFKILLAISVASSGIAGLLFLLVPVGRISHLLPEALPIIINCSEDVHLDVKPPIYCQWRTEATELRLSLHECTYVCENEIDTLKKTLIENWCNNLENCSQIELEKNKFQNGTNFTNSRNYYVTEHQAKQHELFNVSGITIVVNHSQNSDKKTEFKLHKPFCLSKQNDKSNCRLECLAFTDSNASCSNQKYTEDLDMYLTVVTYTIVRAANAVAIAISFTLFESAAMVIMQEHGGNIGLQTVYCNFGRIIMTPISGKLIDYFSSINEEDNYTPAFILYCLTKISCSLIILFINLDFKNPSKRVIKDFKGMLRQGKVLNFLLMVLISGISYGFMETFLFWFLEDMGANKSLMGITVMVGAIFGIPLLLTSAAVINKFGYTNILSLCMMFYTIRMLGYTIISDPWWSMPFAAMEGVTFYMMSVACISYVGVLSTPSTIASLQGIYGGIYHGAGRGLGSLIGGLLMQYFGDVTAFQVLGISCAIGGILYYMVSKIIGKPEDESSETAIINPELKPVGERVKRYTN